MAVLVALALAVLLLSIVIFAVLRTGTESLRNVNPPNMGRGATFSPVVRRTGRPPTGYAVTFRYRDPRATIVQIEGQWSFSSPSLTTIEHSQGLPPSQWKPGEFVVDPNQTAEVQAGVNLTWPLADMHEDPATGVWSFTTPLPSGVFSYAFVVDCQDSELTLTELADPNFPVGYTDCPELVDPSNPPWNEVHGVTHGSVVAWSQVYVPSDPALHTVDNRWEAPTSPRGTLSELSYHGTDGPPSTPGKNRLVVYTPPGYDRHRVKPYPTLYLSHGYDNNEVDWSTGGDAANIVDNLIDSREIEPMVVVMPNAYWVAPPRPTFRGATVYDENLLDNVIPYVESHYDVSRDPSRRAFAGLSYGGFAAGTLLLNYTKEFADYGLFSPAPFTLPTPNGAQAAAIRHVGIQVGAGLDDGADGWAMGDVATLERAGARVTTDFVNGGHDWFVWRVQLRDFLARVAFKHRRA